MYRQEWLEREAELRLDVLPIGKRAHRNRYEPKTTRQGLLDRLDRVERIVRGEQPEAGLRCGRCGQYKAKDEFHWLLRHRTERRRQRYYMPFSGSEPGTSNSFAIKDGALPSDP